ncbi:TolC family protein [Hymenobacter sp. ASUV-10]|uniref:TolC family protein n=1 Tax=Hymenobacter aranciens TaxID=3063996 RepID=A0ABT9BAY8_9BACT|nr:TolC family protein [Hymenobacter sp. ASUV-10]MDO7873866.1 TolC family protein [Hymenobacter sp. ASUV-10]
MLSKRLYQCLGAATLAVAAAACKLPQVATLTQNRSTPAAYANAPAPADSANSARQPWRQFFTDPHLTALIDSALLHNQELNITRQEIDIARNEAQVRKGEYLPFVGLGVRAEAERPGRYTLRGATEEAIDVKPGVRTPDPLANYQLGAFASWEVDIWHRLRNARQAALRRYLASVEGKNFTTTNLVAEIANSYYELLALDNQLAIVRQNIGIQTNALEIVRLQKASARVTELAVQRFEAQVQNTTSRQFDIQQRITETENRLNFLLGRYPQPIVRDAAGLSNLLPPAVQAGLPVQLLQNRPDVRQAELEVQAAGLDVRVARAAFYPALRLSGGAGFEAFRPGLVFSAPESILYSIGGDLAAPLVNRNAIKAVYGSANARQNQAVLNYERTLRNAYVEVANQLANIANLQSSYAAKTREVAALTESVNISTSLFGSARADYTEVLFTQRDAIEARFDVVEIRMQQLQAGVQAYRALGGGWR